MTAATTKSSPPYTTNITLLLLLLLMVVVLTMGAPTPPNGARMNQHHSYNNEGSLTPTEEIPIEDHEKGNSKSNLMGKNLMSSTANSGPDEDRQKWSNTSDLMMEENEEEDPGDDGPSSRHDQQPLEGVNEADLLENSDLQTLNESSNHVSNASQLDDVFKSMRDQVEAAYADRDKERRLEEIRSMILNTTGRVQRPQNHNASVNSPGSQLKDLMDQIMKNHMPWAPADVYTEKVQSFYPSCDVPPKTEPDVWNDESRLEMNLHFNLTYPTPLEGSVVTIVAAKIRLFKISQEGSQQHESTVTSTTACTTHRGTVENVSPAVTTSTGTGTGTMLAVPLPISVSLPPTVPIAPIVSTVPVATETYVDDDRQIRVSVYSYIRALKKTRVRRRLLDTFMVPIQGDQWVELNVRSAAKMWREKSRNFGLVVQVEDEDGKLLPASKFFSAMNCSKEASTSRPIPSFLVEAAREVNGDNVSLQYNPEMFPMIDLCTMEMPENEAMLMKPFNTASGGINVQTANNNNNENLNNARKNMPSTHPNLGGATSVVLIPYTQLMGGAASSDNKLDENNLKTSETTKNKSVAHEEENTAIVASEQHSKQSLNIPEVVETQNEQPETHPHRHHRHNKRIEDSESEEDDDEQEEGLEGEHHHYNNNPSPYPRPNILPFGNDRDVHGIWNGGRNRQHHHAHHHHHHHHSQHHPHHIHHRHRLHQNSGDVSEDWSEESHRLIVLPASELIALSEQAEIAEKLETLQENVDEAAER